MLLAEPWANATATREPVGHHSGTPSTAETSRRPEAGSGSDTFSSSKRGDCSTTRSLRGRPEASGRVRKRGAQVKFGGRLRNSRAQAQPTKRKYLESKWKNFY